MLWTLLLPMFQTLRPAASTFCLKRLKFSRVEAAPPPVVKEAVAVEKPVIRLRAGGHVQEALLVQAATEAVRQWRYRPTLLNGDPCEVDTVIEVRFTLNR
jgi:protein TonB